MSIIDFVPGAKWIEIAVVAAAIASAVGAYALQHHKIVTLTATLAAERTERANERAAAASAALAESTAYRAEEQRRAQAQKEIADETDRQILAARADAARADAVAGSLQHRVAALVAAARAAAGHPTAAGPSAPAGDPLNLLAELQRRADETAGELAKFGDAAAAAGHACEASYDALTR